MHNALVLLIILILLVVYTTFKVCQLWHLTKTQGRRLAFGIVVIMIFPMILMRYSLCTSTPLCWLGVGVMSIWITFMIRHWSSLIRFVTC